MKQFAYQRAAGARAAVEAFTASTAPVMYLGGGTNLADLMRLGVADMTIVDALASTFAMKANRDRVERAYNVSSDLGEVVRVLASKGLDGLDEIHLRLFRPIRAMLAERLETLEEIFARIGKAALEYKYDGLRVQAHISPKRIELCITMPICRRNDSRR